jgi:hypothetical protein
MEQGASIIGSEIQETSMQPEDSTYDEGNLINLNEDMVDQESDGDIEKPKKKKRRRKNRKRAKKDDDIDEDAIDDEDDIEYEIEECGKIMK